MKNEPETDFSAAWPDPPKPDDYDFRAGRDAGPA